MTTQATAMPLADSIAALEILERAGPRQLNPRVEAGERRI